MIITKLNQTIDVSETGDFKQKMYALEQRVILLTGLCLDLKVKADKTITREEAKEWLAKQIGSDKE